MIETIERSKINILKRLLFSCDRSVRSWLRSSGYLRTTTASRIKIVLARPKANTRVLFQFADGKIVVVGSRPWNSWQDTLRDSTLRRDHADFSTVVGKGAPEVNVALTLGKTLFPFSFFFFFFFFFPQWNWKPSSILSRLLLSVV